MKKRRKIAIPTPRIIVHLRQASQYAGMDEAFWPEERAELDEALCLLQYRDDAAAHRNVVPVDDLLTWDALATSLGYTSKCELMHSDDFDAPIYYFWEAKDEHGRTVGTLAFVDSLEGADNEQLRLGYIVITKGKKS